MSIFLVRHAETASNAARVVQTPDTPLSRRGLAQADLLAERLAAEGVAHILASDYSRASMTAERLEGTTGAPVALEPMLRERNYGEIRGRPYTEVGALIFAEDYAPPGGESWEVFHARVDAAWDRIRAAAAAARGNLAVVTHGLVCYSLATRHVRLPDGVDAPRGFPNTSLTVIDAESPWAVRLLACCAHLDGSAVDTPRNPSEV